MTYEEKLSADLEYAFNEGEMHFDEKSAVHRALRGIAKRLDQLGINPYVRDKFIELWTAVAQAPPEE